MMGQADSGRVWSAWKCDAEREDGRPFRGEDTSEGSVCGDGGRHVSITEDDGIERWEDAELE